MNKAKLSKIHKAKTQAWLELWQKFAEFRRYIPDNAKRFLDNDYYAELLTAYLKASEAEQKQIDKHHKDILKQSCKDLGLEYQAWVDWSISFETAISSFDPDKPDLNLSPFNLPIPPLCPPTEVFKQISQWEFKAELDTLPKFNLVYYLAIAQRVCDFKGLE